MCCIIFKLGHDAHMNITSFGGGKFLSMWMNTEAFLNA
jgi:hypothetical protein